MGKMPLSVETYTHYKTFGWTVSAALVCPNCGEIASMNSVPFTDIQAVNAFRVEIKNSILNGTTAKYFGEVNHDCF